MGPARIYLWRKMHRRAIGSAYPPFFGRFIVEVALGTTTIHLTPIFDVVLKRITVRGSIVGTRRDLDEAIAFAVEGKVRADIKTAPLSDINTIFANLKAGKVEGRMVLDLAQAAKTRSEAGELARA